MRAQLSPRRDLPPPRHEAIGRQARSIGHSHLHFDAQRAVIPLTRTPSAPLSPLSAGAAWHNSRPAARD
jgi:hypothetical protein